MGPIIILLIFGTLAYTEACPFCREVSPESPVIHEYLSNTLQSLLRQPSGLQIQEPIQLKGILKAAFQVVRGIKFHYEFEGIGSKSKHLYTCNLVLIRRAWLNERDIEKYECKKRKEKR